MYNKTITRRLVIESAKELTNKRPHKLPTLAEISKHSKLSSTYILANLGFKGMNHIHCVALGFNDWLEVIASRPNATTAHSDEKIQALLEHVREHITERPYSLPRKKDVLELGILPRRKFDYKVGSMERAMLLMLGEVNWLKVVDNETDQAEILARLGRDCYDEI